MGRITADELWDSMQRVHQTQGTADWEWPSEYGLRALHKDVLRAVRRLLRGGLVDREEYLAALARGGEDRREALDTLVVFAVHDVVREYSRRGDWE